MWVLCIALHELIIANLDHPDSLCMSQIITEITHINSISALFWRKHRNIYLLFLWFSVVVERHRDTFHFNFPSSPSFKYNQYYYFHLCSLFNLMTFPELYNRSCLNLFTFHVLQRINLTHNHLITITVFVHKM